MRKAFILICAFLVLIGQGLLADLMVVRAQMLMQTMGTPYGTFFTESFGDAGGPCGYGAPWNLGLYQYSGCNAIWGSVTVGTSGSVSIASSPGSRVWPRGNKSLEVVTGTTATYVQTAGFTPTNSASQTFDVSFTFYPVNLTLATYTASTLLIFSPTTAASSFPCRIAHYTVTANVEQLAGIGSNFSSSSATLSFNADHTVFMHCVPGGSSGSSYISVDGGSHLTFTANATAWNVITWGDITGAAASATYYIGNILINSSAQGQGSGPGFFWVGNTGQPNGTAFTSAILLSGQVGGNSASGSWSSSGTTSVMTVQSSAVLALKYPLDMLGRVYGTTGDTDAWQYALSGATGSSWLYQATTFSPVSTELMHLSTSMYDTSTSASWGFLENSAGIDYADVMTYDELMYLEVKSSPNTAPIIGAKFPYSASTAYILEVQAQMYNAGSVAGGVYYVTGSVTSGTFTANESLSQAASGATATLIGTVTGSNGMKLQMVSGTADSSHVWTGGTSGAQYTPTSVPTTFHTLWIWDGNCNLQSSYAPQVKLAYSSSPNPFIYLTLGRMGDSGEPSAVTNIDKIIVDYARGQFIPCQ